nr:TOMM20-like protein 1 isoform X3 [Chrysemys picta bellii]
MSGWARPLLLLLAGACGLTLLGYAVYFDRQRRNAPDFKRKLRQKRRKEREKAKEHDAELCEMKNIGRVQEFFLQEVQLGEHWLSIEAVQRLGRFRGNGGAEGERLQAALNEQDCVEDEKE